MREWLGALEDELACAVVLLPDACDGRELLQRWPASRLAHTCLGGDMTKVPRLYEAIRRESARVDERIAAKRGRVRGLAGRWDDKHGQSAKARQAAATTATTASTAPTGNAPPRSRPRRRRRVPVEGVFDRGARR